MERFVANKITEEIKKTPKKKIQKKQKQKQNKKKTTTTTTKEWKTVFKSCAKYLSKNNEYSPPQELNTVFDFFSVKYIKGMERNINLHL